MDVASGRFSPSGGVILAHLHPQGAELGEDRIDDLALLPGRAANLAKPDECLAQP